MFLFAGQSNQLLDRYHNITRSIAKRKIYNNHFDSYISFNADGVIFQKYYKVDI